MSSDLHAAPDGGLGARAAYAASVGAQRGRRIAEAPALPRSEFQRDRDRIVHSTAFRRLEYKTQVFVNHEGDLFRTRLTHTIEVAQIARSIARRLALDEDLVEAIALAHDLGHTPFGHAGQDTLNECMKDHGGFEHNLQSLRVVDELEHRYAAFDGLNLCFDTREGILKHCARENARALGEIGERFLTGGQPSLEAQVANLADEIAYNNHDVDDGLRAGLITLLQLEEVDLFQVHATQVRSAYPEIQDRRMIHETVRRMIDELVGDLLAETRRRIARLRPAAVADVRAGPPLVAFSEAMRPRVAQLRRFLHANLYRHYQVVRMSAKSARVISELFAAFLADERLLPDEHRDRVGAIGPRAISDYIAGMTDRYAIGEHRRLFAFDAP